MMLRKKWKNLSIVLVFSLVAMLITPPVFATVDTFVATEDAYVNHTQGTTGNYDMLKPYLSTKIVYMKFNVSGINDTVNSVKLQLTTNSQSDGGDAGLEVYLGDSNSWSETTITSSNAPSSGVLLGSYNGAINASSTIHINLDKSVINADDTYTLIMKTANTDVRPVFLSKDATYASSSDHPSLIIDSVVGDTTAPSAVSDLTTSNATSSSIDLSWIAPGDDGSSGTATTYDIRYSTSLISNDTDFNNATEVTGEPNPSIAGTSESMTVSGLTTSTTYYFAIKTTDDASNTSTLSNVPSETTLSSTTNTLTFSATEDAYTQDGSNNNNNLLKIQQNSSERIGYLKFDVSGISGTVDSVKLLLTNTTDSGMPKLRVYDGLSNSWSESTITGANAPGEGSLRGSYDLAIALDETISIDLGTYITTDGTFTLIVKATNGTNDAWFNSSEATTGHPQLEITTSGDDSIAPAAVSDLTTSNATSSSIGLSWTAPGDDGSSGTATSYDIRYSTSLISNDTDFNNATQVTGEPNPSIAGTSDLMTVSGLSASTTYYFAMKTTDEGSNTSALSNVPSETTLLGDSIAPAAVSDLTTSNATSSSIDLFWTAPGDDGSSGTATSYDIRYSRSLINESNFNSATEVTGEPNPSIAGTSESMTVSGLSVNATYYFALKATDESNNTSDISRIGIITTELGAGGVTCDHMITQSLTGNIYGDASGMNAQPGDIICIDSGRTSPIPLFNFTGTAENPITFINYGGQVLLEGGNFWAIVVRGSSHFRITGTGDPSYQYGIKIDPEHGTGIEVASLSTNLEIDHVWISEVENDGNVGAGLSLRSNPTCNGTANRGNFTQYNTIVHHNLIEGTENEGIYIGSSNYHIPLWTDCDNDPNTGVNGKEYDRWGAPLIGVRVFDNMINDGGRDGIQVGSAVQDVEVYNNQITNYGTRNDYPHLQGIEINPGTTGKFYNNIVNGGVGHGISVQGRGDIQIFNNIIIDSGDGQRTTIDGIYSHDRQNDGTVFPDSNFDNSPIHIWNNTIINPYNYGIDFNNMQNYNNTIRNNVIVQSSGNYFDISDPNEMTQSNNHTTTSVSNPGFVNASIDDYHLQSTSPLIDAGYDLKSEGILFDYDNNARPVGAFDIGAFEYVAP